MVLERFDRELAHSTHDPLHEGDLEAEAIPDRWQRTRVTRDLSGKRVTFCEGWIEFGSYPKEPSRACFRDFFGSGFYFNYHGVRDTSAFIPIFLSKKPMDSFVRDYRCLTDADRLLCVCRETQAQRRTHRD